MIIGNIAEAVRSGARRSKACETIGLSLRTIQRWKQRPEGGEDLRQGPSDNPGNRLSEEERAEVLRIANSPSFRFRYGTGTWSQEAKLLPSDGAGGDWFGYSVSVSGDVALVGAYMDDDNGSSSGSAYVFRYNAGSWTEEAKLTASDGAANDIFAQSVSVSGDVALIGARLDDDNVTDSGSAYVFRYNAGTWSQEAKLTASDGAADDWFGYSISVSADVALIGAHPDDDNGTSSGSAYVFRYDAETGWSQEAKLTASDGAEGDCFGYSVSVAGNVALIGARRDDDNGDSSGSAYVFRYDAGTGWSQEDKLTASDGATDDNFGVSVSVSGDNGLISSYLDDDSGSASGSAYFFHHDAGNWTEKTKLIASDGAANDYFGEAVSLSGNSALLGAPREDEGGTDAGAGYVFTMDPTLVTLVSFTATRYGNSVELYWETASEIDNAGFHLWRSDEESGPYTRITTQLIPAKGGISWGAEYYHADGNVVSGISYFYRLEDIDFSGDSTFHGPVSTEWKDTLNADIVEMSIGEGGTVRFFMRTGIARSGRDYVLLGSMSGSSPGTLLPGGLAVLPLNIDHFTKVLLQHSISGSPWCTGFLDTMDSDGTGSAVLNIPQELGLTGKVLYFAFALRSPWDFVSTPVEVVVLP